MQPVLQWGASPAGGGNYWAIANWYVWESGAAVSSLISNVNPGTNLQGVIDLIGQNSDGSYNYTSSFTGYTNTLAISEGDVDNGAAIPSVPVQFAAFETLEVYHTVNGVTSYGIGQSSDYPANTYNVVMNNITLSRVNGYPTSAGRNPFPLLDWIPGTLTANVGENTNILNGDDEGQGQVALNFHSAPAINGTSVISLNQTNIPCVITGYPGYAVSVKLSIDPVHGGSATGTFTITTPGVLFSEGSASISVTNSDIIQTFIMPASGSITGNASISIASNGGIGLPPSGGISVY